MFSKTKKSTDPTGFDVLALVCGLAVNRADLLCKDEYLGGISTSTFLLNLKNAIIDCVNIVSRNINNYMGFGLFRYDYLFSEDKINDNTLLEIENIKKVIK